MKMSKNCYAYVITATAKGEKGIIGYYRSANGQPFIGSSIWFSDFMMSIKSAKAALQKCQEVSSTICYPHIVEWKIQKVYMSSPEDIELEE